MAAAKRPDPPKLWRSVFYPPAGYRYFDSSQPPAFNSSPRIGNLNVLKAAWLADAAALAYARSGSDRIPTMQLSKILEGAGFVHLDLLGDWSGGPRGTQGYFAFTREFAVLAFRGTEKDDWTDLASDLATWPVEEDETKLVLSPAEKTMLHLPPLPKIFGHAKPAVHFGFQAALNEVWTKAKELLHNYRAGTQNEIFFTGHSLGAAMATLAAARFDGGNASLYTFGSPRVGNRAFLDTLRAKINLGQYRIASNHDLVTRVPPQAMFYAHENATLYQLQPGGGVVDRTADPNADPGDGPDFLRDLKALSQLSFPIEDDTVPPDDIYDHAPGCYCNRIWNAL